MSEIVSWRAFKFLVKHSLRNGPRFTRWYLTCHSEGIMSWRNPFASREPGKVPVHFLTGRDQYKMCIWSIASFVKATQRNWSFHIHDDGTLRGGEEAPLRAMGLSARLHYRKRANDTVDKALVSYPLCSEHRRRLPVAIKLYDFVLLTPGARYIMIDTDVLFFDAPTEILRWVDSGSESFFFNEDVIEANLVSQDAALNLFGISLWPRVNVGLCCIPRAAMSLTDSEGFLRKSGMLTMPDIWTIEQTLYALHASKFNAGGLLPRGYELSISGARRPDGVCRHYVGAVRDRFYTEGIPEIARRLGRLC